MRLIFLGSPESVIKPLLTLLEDGPEHGHEVVAVVSQPARPVGRRGTPEDPPVARFAKEQGLVTLQPEKASDPDFLKQLAQLAPDVMITAAYGQILSEEFLAIPKRGTINIHPSLLPKYRGATPVPAALLDGCKETGVSILFTVAKLDAGNIICQAASTIRSDETAAMLTERLFAQGGILTLTALDQLKNPSFLGYVQEPAAVTHCRKIKKTDGLIAWGQTTEVIINRFRAFHPWPGSYTFLQDRRLNVLRMNHPCGAIGETKKNKVPGTASFDKARKVLQVTTADGAVDISSLQFAGGKVIDAVAFWNGLKNREVVFLSTPAESGVSSS